MIRHLIILDDLRENTSTAKFLCEELREEITNIDFKEDIVCAPSPVKAWAEKDGRKIVGYESFRDYLTHLKDPIILIDWGMPIPSFLWRADIGIEMNNGKLDGLYLFYLIRNQLNIKHCFLWSQFPFSDAEDKASKLYQNLDMDFTKSVRESWLYKATVTGRDLAERVRI